MKQKKFRIGELSKKLQIKKFVIRFWEKEFDLKSDRSGGGQRFYTQQDLDTFKNIKELLYKKKFTISGAKKELNNPTKNNKLKPAITEQFTEETNNCKVITKSFFEKLDKLKEQLLNLKNQL